MSTPKVVVRRSPWKVMAIGLVGVPLVLLVVDYVWGIAGLFDLVIDWAYGPKDPEPFEPRDDILAALLAVTGGTMVLFALKELVAPRRLLLANTEGLRLPLSGPFGRTTEIGWLQVDDIETGPTTISVNLAHAGGVPEDPWGARWVADRTLRLSTWWWDRPAEEVLDEIAQKGLPDDAQRRRREIALEESRAHAAAMELISGAAVVADPTIDDTEEGSGVAGDDTEAVEPPDDGPPTADDPVPDGEGEGPDGPEGATGEDDTDDRRPDD